MSYTNTSTLMGLPFSESAGGVTSSSPAQLARRNAIAAMVQNIILFIVLLFLLIDVCTAGIAYLPTVISRVWFVPPVNVKATADVHS